MTNQQAQPSPAAGRGRHLVWPLLAVVLAVAGWAYSQAWSGAWYYDDGPSLAGLERVDDWLSALDYIRSGHAGPLGRPLTLATFAAQAESWPDRPRDFLIVNTAIHLLNGLLAFVLALLLARMVAPDPRQARWIALAAAACWTLSPFLASSAWLVVQRMTLLSASLVLAGMIVYLLGRQRMDRSPRLGLAMMLGAITFGTGLGVLAKENGILLPLLIGVTEVFLLPRSEPGRTPLPRLVRLALVLPALAIGAYLIHRLFAGGYDWRPFDQQERLLSQPRALWEYLRYLLLPTQFSVQPFMDGFAASTGLFRPPTTFFALLGGLVAVALTWWLRRFSRLPLFAATFFLAGHLLESSSVPLNLYFAHRNYLPSFGLYFAIAAVLLSTPLLARARRLVVAGLGAYVLLFAAILFDTASLWGAPQVAAQYWTQVFPDSIRAHQFQIQNALRAGAWRHAEELMDQVRQSHPDHVMLALQDLQLCAGSRAAMAAKLDRADRAMSRQGRLLPWEAGVVQELARASVRGQCPLLPPSLLMDLVDQALTATSHQGTVRSRLVLAKAQLAQGLGNPDLALTALEEAWRLAPSARIATLIAYQQVQKNDLAAARTVLEQALKQAPDDPLDRRLWRREINEYLARLSDAPQD